MPKTPKLGITITTDDSTTFEAWRESINGDNESSLALIVDAFATQVLKSLDDLEGGGINLDMGGFIEQEEPEP